MTVFLQRPCKSIDILMIFFLIFSRLVIDQCEVPYYRQTPVTPTYPQSARIDYY